MINEFTADKLIENQSNSNIFLHFVICNKNISKMPPNAGPSMVATVCPNQQPTMMKGQMVIQQMNSAQPRSSLRRSPSAFGGFCPQSMASISSSSKPPLNLRRCVFGAHHSSPTEAEMSKENVPIAVCPAPANQIELEFSLATGSYSTPLQIQIHSPSGDFGQINLDGATNQSGTFCARQSHRCGHGQWKMRVILANGGNVLKEMKLELDGVGSVHFFWNGKKLELTERNLLWMPGTACCPSRLMTEREIGRK